MPHTFSVVTPVARRMRRNIVALLALSGATLGLATPAFASGGTTTGADLQISGSASTNAPLTTATFTVTFLVKNSGPDTATSSVFTDTVQAGLVYDSGTVDGAAVSCPGTTDSSGNDVVTCSLGDLASGAQATIVTTLTAPSTVGSYTSTGTTSSAVTDPNTTNNGVVVDVTTKSSTGGGGGGGGTTTTGLPPGPCATISTNDLSDTTAGPVVMKWVATVTSCSGDNQTDLVVTWDSGFPCAAPQSQPYNFSLASGASTKISCSAQMSFPNAYIASGTGTATLYDNCVSLDQGGSIGSSSDPTSSLLDPSQFCSAFPSTVVATTTYNWSVSTPAAPPPGRNRPA